jgi:DNA mismatch repair ATPase MutL
MSEVIRRNYQKTIDNDLYTQDLLNENMLPDKGKLDNQILFINNRFYVLPELRLKILKIYHDTPLAGHYGKLRTQKLVERNYF